MARDSKKNQVDKSIRVDEEVYRRFRAECYYQDIRSYTAINQALRNWTRSKSGKTRHPNWILTVADILKDAIEYVNTEARLIPDDHTHRLEESKRIVKRLETGIILIEKG